MASHVPRITESNQGYWDRLKRARSWIDRASALHSKTPEDKQGLFICYWIAFNALYGRVNENRLFGTERRYLRATDDDAQWFIGRICSLDSGAGRIHTALLGLRDEAHELVASPYLSEAYWREGYSAQLRKHIVTEIKTAEEALAEGDDRSYLELLLCGRIRVLRNQILHGCSTNRDSLNRSSLDPALTVLQSLIPIFVEIMATRHDKDTDWGKIPFPRSGSPQHPEPAAPRR